MSRTRTDLTPRQTEAIMHVMQGKGIAQTAIAMRCGERTVRFHLDNARRKLNAVNLPHLVAIFIAMQQRQMVEEAQRVSENMLLNNIRMVFPT